MLRRITLSRATLHAALDAVAAEHGARDAVIDVRADAYGHGAEIVEQIATSHGFTRFVRDGSGGSSTGNIDALESALTALVYGTRPGSSPVMTVSGEVVACKRVHAGDAVSYGYTYRLESDSHLALVGLGYADGVPRAASNQARALIGQAQHILAGRVAMDQFMLDLGDDRARPGDEVVLWGDAPGAPAPEEWAQASGRLPLELTARLGNRFERRWVVS